MKFRLLSLKRDISFPPQLEQTNYFDARYAQSDDDNVRVPVASGLSLTLDAALPERP
jgi:hypothetical protein